MPYSCGWNGVSIGQRFTGRNRPANHHCRGGAVAEVSGLNQLEGDIKGVRVPGELPIRRD